MIVKAGVQKRERKNQYINKVPSVAEFRFLSSSEGSIADVCVCVCVCVCRKT